MAKQLIYLVIDNGKSAAFLPHAQRYRIFTDKAKAVEHAVSRGLEGLSFRPPRVEEVSDKPGMMTFYKGGDADVSLMPLEVDAE